MEFYSHHVSFLLPPAYVVWREGTVFTGVCLLTSRWGGGYLVSDFRGGGTWSQIFGGGVPGLRFSGGGTWSQIFGGVPGLRFSGGVPGLRLLGGVYPVYGYTAGGMPLAFTQEDFLVRKCCFWQVNYRTRFLWFHRTGLPIPRHLTGFMEVNAINECMQIICSQWSLSISAPVIAKYYKKKLSPIYSLRFCLSFGIAKPPPKYQQSLKGIISDYYFKACTTVMQNKKASK